MMDNSIEEKENIGKVSFFFYHLKNAHRGYSLLQKPRIGNLNLRTLIGYINTKFRKKKRKVLF